jgi:two-component system response regulator NreC
MTDCETERPTPVKLFLVDDHAVVRQALCEVLSSRNKYEVVGEASDGEDLLSHISDQPTDLIILDLSMPNTGGIETIQELRRRGNNLPVLVLSADDSSKSIMSALKAGARGFLPKQVGLTEVEFAIDAVLSGKTYLSPSVTDKIVGGNGDYEGTHSSCLKNLSKREREIFQLLAEGRPNREIGKLLHISTRTVDTHRSNILKKLEVRSNAELVRIAISEGALSVGN